MQVDPLQPKLKEPETKRLKLSRGEPPSNFAFKFKLRRYNKVNQEFDPTKFNFTKAGAYTRSSST